jgi:lactate dehydrogenase-like 2-hydroxyacid dehydrogenase
VPAGLWDGSPAGSSSTLLWPPAVQAQSQFSPGFAADEAGLTPSERAGREIWFFATAGNDRFQSNNTSSNRAGITLMNNQVGYVVAQVMREKDNIDVEECTRRGIAACITPDVLTDATADFAFALLIASARRVAESSWSIPRGEWKTWEPLGYLGQEVHGSTLGIVGMGRIGTALARRASGFSMRVLYSDVGRNESAERETGAVYGEFDDLLRESDFVSIHVPLTPETVGLFGGRDFGLMKSSAILINSGSCC